MNKPFVTVTLILHGGESKTISDYVDNSGKFQPIGTQARATLGRHEALHFKDEQGVETVIPYHAVNEWHATVEQEAFTAPQDDFCDTGGGE